MFICAFLLVSELSTTGSNSHTPSPPPPAPQFSAAAPQSSADAVPQSSADAVPQSGACTSQRYSSSCSIFEESGASVTTMPSCFNVSTKYVQSTLTFKISRDVSTMGYAFLDETAIRDSNSAFSESNL